MTTGASIIPIEEDHLEAELKERMTGIINACLGVFQLVESDCVSPETIKAAMDEIKVEWSMAKFDCGLDVDNTPGWDRVANQGLG